jgi:nitrogen-specific signal transduction histidine kinase
VTERRRAEEALRHSEEQLRQSQKMEAIGRLAGGVAHDFNNLLTVILSYSDVVLADSGHGSHFHEEVSEIRKAGERAAGLTRQLLAFSRRQVLQPKIIDINSVILDLDKMLQRIIGEDIDLMTQLSPDLGKIEADPGQIEQVLMNLAVNARDAMPEGGQITIETANVELSEGYAQLHMAVRPGPHVMLAVSDTGTGMSAETQARIFEPFFTTKPEGKGTGLGLSTIYGIIKQSGGNIWVYSELGKGTTFKIYLPRVRGSAVAPERVVVPRSLSAASETVLVVEDDDSVRRLSTTILRKHGYNIIEARSGVEALNIFQEHAGDLHLVITDVVMPQMGGRELALRLQKSHPDLKVLYVSGYTDEAIVRHGILHPGTLFLQKPFTPQSLIHKVREVLDGSRGGL